MATEKMTVDRLQALLHEHDNGLLSHGSHTAGSREFCALEFDAIVRGRVWSDAPITLPDLRPLNDARWPSNEERTKALLPVMAALWNWSQWTPERQQRWASYVAIETVRQIISALPGLSVSIAQQCRDARDVGAAAAAYAAYAAAYSAYAANSSKPLHTACAIWIEAVVRCNNAR